MPLYRVTCHVTLSGFTFVHADSAKDAKLLAGGRTVVLCPGGAARFGSSPLDEVIIEEADGTPEVVSVFKYDEGVIPPELDEFDVDDDADDGEE